MDIHTMEGLQELVDDSVKAMKEQRIEAEKREEEKKRKREIENHLKYLRDNGMTPETEQIIIHAQKLKKKEIEEEEFQQKFKENMELIKEMEQKEKEKQIIQEGIEQQEYFKNNCEIQ